MTETITVKAPSVETNSVGEQVTTYTDKAVIRARNVLNRGNRTNSEGDVWMPRTHTLEVRIYQNIDDHDIIAWKGKLFRILSLEVDRPLMCQRLIVEEIEQ